MGRSTMNRLRKLMTGQRGSSGVALVLAVPALLLVVGVLIYAGRMAMAKSAVESAAASAARDGSLARDSATANRAAMAAAARSLAQQDTQCTSIDARVDSRGLNAPLGQIGTVRVTVTCVANLRDITYIGIPGTRTFEATAISPVDPYRQR
jgi:Flp pilus assembly protein TadG